MLRKTIFACSIALGTLFAGAKASAVEITSAANTIKSIGETFTFDFNGDPDLPLVNNSSRLLGVKVEWVFTPGAGGSGSVDLIADLFVPPVGGDDTGVGFDSEIDLAAGPSDALAVNFSSTGLTFSNTVIAELLGGVPGVLEGVISVLNPNIPALNDFFNGGGEVTGVLTLTFEEGNPGGGGDPVPEPASILIWSLVGAGALARRRYAARKNA